MYIVIGILAGIIILQAIIDWNALKTVINSLFVNHIAIKKGKVKNYGN